MELLGQAFVSVTVKPLFCTISKTQHRCSGNDLWEFCNQVHNVRKYEKLDCNLQDRSDAAKLFITCTLLRNSDFLIVFNFKLKSRSILTKCSASLKHSTLCHHSKKKQITKSKQEYIFFYSLTSQLI